MKSILSTLIAFLVMFVVACVPLQASQPASIDLPRAASETMPTSTQHAVEATTQGSGMIVEMSSATVMSLPTIPATADAGEELSSSSVPPKNEVTFAENGSIFVMYVGESFLLNLDMDGYDWTMEIDNQNIIQRELNVMVPRDAQGIYIAQNPGTAILIATGDPFCRQSKPPCMRPTILFSITVTVN